MAFFKELLARQPRGRKSLEGIAKRSILEKNGRGAELHEGQRQSRP